MCDASGESTTKLHTLLEITSKPALRHDCDVEKQAAPRLDKLYDSLGWPTRHQVCKNDPRSTAVSFTLFFVHFDSLTTSQPFLVFIISALHLPSLADSYQYLPPQSRFSLQGFTISEVLQSFLCHYLDTGSNHTRTECLRNLRIIHNELKDNYCDHESFEL